jgi:hypothetical protein
MSERQAVAVRDEAGNLFWFPVVEAMQWAGTTLQRGNLYHAAGQWVLLDELATITGEPARILSDDAALEWLLTNGYLPHDDLTNLSARIKLEYNHDAE